MVSALLLSEGIGLLMEQVWAEYTTVLIVSTFIPPELHELIRRTTPSQTCMLAINGVVVGYLVMRLIQREPANTTASKERGAQEKSVASEQALGQTATVDARRFG